MNTTELKLRFYPDNILRKKASLVRSVDNEIKDILKQMSEIMYEHKGVGLAANQVGLNISLLVADPGDHLYKLVNPKIIYKEGNEVMEEGCLSLPNLCVKIKRAKKIIVKALDEKGNSITMEADNLLSRILQHEIDHLNGKLIIDYLPLFKRILVKRKLKRLKAI
ncbi:MAG: peptide deformylase [Candidatus Omnitrophica bacterium]|nr:peptide deformylase [Candidatus Omnitrophota bacterium]